MPTRIIEYTGKDFATCDKCGQMVPFAGKFDPAMGCATISEVTAKFGSVTETRKVPCDGKMKMREIARISGGVKYTFEPKQKIAGVACVFPDGQGRRVALVTDSKFSDANVQYFDENMVKPNTNNDWHWAVDLEEKLMDKESLGVVERHVPYLKKLLGVEALEKRLKDLEKK